jgi:hypothetical protein
MQYGVLVDFFDSVGIRINTSFSEGYSVMTKRGYFCSMGADKIHYTKTYITRHEARQKAIEKAVEIYNQQ